LGRVCCKVDGADESEDKIGVENDGYEVYEI
jgi:hypothetical protein